MRKYKRIKIRAGGNRKTEKNILDVVRGCGAGRHNEGKGCYGSCYAAKMATMSGVDFSQPVSMILDGPTLKRSLEAVDQDWIRIGVAGDPCWDWRKTAAVAAICKAAGKVPVIITKAWVKASDRIVDHLVRSGAILHVSISVLDRRKLVDDRARFRIRYEQAGGDMVVRLITVPVRDDKYKVGRYSQETLIGWATRNEYLVLEPPLRCFSNNQYIKDGTIDRSRMHNHVSVISGKEDGQLTGGRMIPEGPKVGYCDTACKDCENQCWTVRG